MADGQQPLTWETSANSKPEISDSLPDSVVSCLQNAKYLHLATCTDLKPHVSLMNYTYIPSHPFNTSTLPRGPIIVMTTNPSSQKTRNLTSNPNVSLLVHDWVSSRAPQASKTSSSSPPPDNASSRPGGGQGRSSLASLLMGMNSSEMGSISATMNGTAAVLERGSEVETWCREEHLKFNGFDDRPAAAATNGTHGSLAQLSGSPDARFTEDKGAQEGGGDVRVVVVRIKDGRIADWKGSVRDFVLTGSD